MTIRQDAQVYREKQASTNGLKGLKSVGAVHRVHRVEKCYINVSPFIMHLLISCYNNTDIFFMFFQIVAYSHIHPTQINTGTKLDLFLPHYLTLFTSHCPSHVSDPDVFGLGL